MKGKSELVAKWKRQNGTKNVKKVTSKRKEERK
jgi:hypothetical protein